METLIRAVFGEPASICGKGREGVSADTHANIKKANNTDITLIVVLLLWWPS
jgi:hypothetical protein